jgi:FkbM family methyltransferase
MSAEGDVDKVVREAFFPGAKDGVLVEVGAARPDYLSIGESFRKAGWRVIGVEPNPRFAELHRALGNEIYEYACSMDEQDDVDFQVISANEPFELMDGLISDESFSSLKIRGEYALLFEKISSKFSIQTIKVKVRKLDTILRDIAKVSKVDVLAIDVEGWERECLMGLKAYRPKVIIAENLFNTDLTGELLLGRGYVHWRTLAPNDVYVLADELPA